MLLGKSEIVKLNLYMDIKNYYNKDTQVIAMTTNNK